MKQNIKEKVLNEARKNPELYDLEKVIDLTLAEVGKVIDGLWDRIGEEEIRFDEITDVLKELKEVLGI